MVTNIQVMELVAITFITTVRKLVVVVTGIKDMELVVMITSIKDMELVDTPIPPAAAP